MARRRKDRAGVRQTRPVRAHSASVGGSSPVSEKGAKASSTICSPPRPKFNGWKNGHSRRSGDNSQRASRLHGQFVIADEDFPALPGARKGFGSSAPVSVVTTANRLRIHFPMDTASTTSMMSSDSGVTGGSSSVGSSPPLVTTDSVGSSPTAVAGHEVTSFLKLTSSRVGDRQPELRGGNAKRGRDRNNQQQQPMDKDRDKTPKVEKEIGSNRQPSAFTSPAKIVAPPTSPVNFAEKLLAPPSEQRLRSDVPQIFVGSNGEMSNIPASMLDDQFGMAAMVARLRAFPSQTCGAMDLSSDALERNFDPFNGEFGGSAGLANSVNILISGIQLVPFNVNAAPGSLWKTFGGPFSAHADNLMDEPANVPPEYHMIQVVEKKLMENMVNKIGVNELFYIFYNFVSEVMQERAARELNNRNWRYHMKEKIWMKRTQPEKRNLRLPIKGSSFGHPIGSATVSGDPAVIQATDTFEIGIYDVYDPIKGRVMTREMKVMYADIERVTTSSKSSNPSVTAMPMSPPKDVGVVGGGGTNRSFGFKSASVPNSLRSLFPGHAAMPPPHPPPMLPSPKYLRRFF